MAASRFPPQRRVMLPPTSLTTQSPPLRLHRIIGIPLQLRNVLGATRFDAAREFHGVMRPGRDITAVVVALCGRNPLPGRLGERIAERCHDFDSVPRLPPKSPCIDPNSSPGCASLAAPVSRVRQYKRPADVPLGIEDARIDHGLLRNRSLPWLDASGTAGQKISQTPGRNSRIRRKTVAAFSASSDVGSVCGAARCSFCGHSPDRDELAEAGYSHTNCSPMLTPHSICPSPRDRLSRAQTRVEPRRPHQIIA